MPEGLDLSTLKPASPPRERKRIGRGLGSGKGRYSGRGLKGQKARSGSHKMRAGFEGGQMPIYMRVGKLRGSTSKDAMPVGPFRTHVWALNVSSLERFDAGSEVTPEVLRAAGLIRNTRFDVKILGQGELTRSLTISAHRFSASAVQKIEAAGGTVKFLRDPEISKKKRARKARAQPETEDAPEAPASEEAEPE